VALFDPAGHEPLTDRPWDEALARSAIHRIADASFDAFDADAGWATHALDDPRSPDQRLHMLYCGSGGVIWALEHLHRQGAIERRMDLGPLVAGIVLRNRADLESARYGTQSFFLGDSGLQLLQWTLSPDPATADQLHATVRSNLKNTAREPLWGSPGSVLAAIHMAEASGEARWRELVREAVQVLKDEMVPARELGGAWVWEQDLWDSRQRMLGAAHGFAGNVYPVLRGAAMLDAALVTDMMARALTTLVASAEREDGMANWYPAVAGTEQTRGKLPLVQDCHGAPGIVCRLAGAPRSAGWDELLLSAGELTWRAGPLAKGASLCHGSAGSGMAMLKLWRRSGDELWLRRARAFGMHCIEQVERHRSRYGMARHSLWTGDPGVACFLWNCVSGAAAFPTLDVF
jgi:hypothetical protein